ncbi:MAG: helix-turn-helix transcriptional regulator [Smithella sp.]
MQRELHTTLGDRLLFLRHSTKTTLQTLSNETGVSRSNLGKYEKDNVKPTADAIIAICSFYNVSADWLLFGKEQVSKDDTTDPELKQMYDVLKNLMQNPDPNLRGWAIVQFRKSFGEYWVTEEKEQ